MIFYVDKGIQFFGKALDKIKACHDGCSCVAHVHYKTIHPFYDYDGTVKIAIAHRLVFLFEGNTTHIKSSPRQIQWCYRKR